MLGSNSFDEWQKDVFFSAAEAVQESADVMESTYRLWERNRRDGSSSDGTNDLHRELLTALGTAKWQLEEFEKATKTYHPDGVTDDTASRHKQFIVAIESQVSRIEKTIRDYMADEGKKPFRWVQLDKVERDELALFLSATPELQLISKDVKSAKGPSVLEASQTNYYDGNTPREGEMNGSYSRGIVNDLKEVKTIDMEDNLAGDLTEREVSKATQSFQPPQEALSVYQRTCSYSDIRSWNIDVVNDNVQRNTSEVQTRSFSPFCCLVKAFELRTKLSLFRNSFRKRKVDSQQERIGPVSISNYLNWRVPQRLTQGISTLNERSRNCLSNCREDIKASHSKQLFGGMDGFRRQFRVSQFYLQSSPTKVVLAIVLILVFVVFVVVHVR